MSPKSETRGNARRVWRQLLQNTLRMSTVREDAEDKNVGGNCELSVVLPQGLR